MDDFREPRTADQTAYDAGYDAAYAALPLDANGRRLASHAAVKFVARDLRAAWWDGWDTCVSNYFAHLAG